MKRAFSAIDLAVFKSRFAAICEEMGVVLCRSSFSPNIKERKDFSCALFDGRGRLVSQAAHIPVHLGSMPLSVQAARAAYKLRPGDAVILNDPFRGGTHLPDITMVTPVFVGSAKQVAFLVANRAHHADVGGQSPGSMPLAARLEDEGVIIPPTLLLRRGRPNAAFMNAFLKQVRRPEERRADLQAQLASNQVGARRLGEYVASEGLARLQTAMRAHRDYEARITRQAFAQLPRGEYRAEDYLDDDGLGTERIRIAVRIAVRRGGLTVDFRGSADQVRGPVNATRAITASAVAYVLRCLVLALSGEDCLSLDEVVIKTRSGSVVDARYPSAVAGGNVETSQRLVDVLLKALHPALPGIIPAASQGTMNNIAIGNRDFGYYETLGGGTGALRDSDGCSAIHSHMTNTFNTPIEALEHELPLRITAYQIRTGSGGKGKRRGGDGLIREYEFLSDAHLSILSERRVLSPYGFGGGKTGKTGNNWLIPPFSKENGKLPGKFEGPVKKGSRLRIETPGGGGFGRSIPRRSR